MAPRTAPLRANLFIAGAPKCGTTAWVSYLGSHRDIYFAEMKEPNFFATDFPRMRWVANSGEYERLFARAGDAKVIGEASAMYLYSTQAAKNIRNYNPDARILLFLRRPEDFLPALHHQLLYRFVETIDDFETAWRLSGKRPPATIPKTCRDPKLLDYASFGRFGEQIERYFGTFAPEQICVVQFDEWTKQPRETYVRILDFLGLDDDGRNEFPRINEAKSYRSAWLGRLIAHPPAFLQLAVKLLRKITGRSALGLGAKASELLAVKGYRTSMNEEVRTEIRRYYKDDQRLLETVLRRGASAKARRESQASQPGEAPTSTP